MPAAKDVVLCRYHYDPLDRLVGHSPAGADSVQRFYQKNRLTTEIQGLVQRSIIQTEDQLLAQHEGGNCTLLATDQQRSVLHELTATQQRSVTYTPYGFRSQQLDLPGFNGEQPDPVTGHYLLGNGYRAFNPVLMRFNSPDSLSPFGAGGLNAYAYCVGDPVNRVDPSGHTPSFLKPILRGVGLMRKNKPAVVTSAASLSSTAPPSGALTTSPLLTDEAVLKFYDTRRLSVSAYANDYQLHSNSPLTSNQKIWLEREKENITSFIGRGEKVLNKLYQNHTNGIHYRPILRNHILLENQRTHIRAIDQKLGNPPTYEDTAGLPSYIDAAVNELRQKVPRNKP